VTHKLALSNFYILIEEKEKLALDPEPSSDTYFKNIGECHVDLIKLTLLKRLTVTESWCCGYPTFSVAGADALNRREVGSIELYIASIDAETEFVGIDGGFRDAEFGHMQAQERGKPAFFVF
jgi:hypothetical protein